MASSLSTSSKKLAVKQLSTCFKQSAKSQTSLKRKSIADISNALSPSDCSMINLKDISFGGTHSRVLLSLNSLPLRTLMDKRSNLGWELAKSSKKQSQLLSLIARGPSAALSFHWSKWHSSSRRPKLWVTLECRNRESQRIARLEQPGCHSRPGILLRLYRRILRWQSWGLSRAT